mgnify:CR=1 FL=1
MTRSDDISISNAPSLVADLSDLPDSLRNACQLYAVVTLAQANIFLSDLEVWPAARECLGVSQPELDQTRAQITALIGSEAVETPDYKGVPCGVPLGDRNQNDDIQVAEYSGENVETDINKGREDDA